MSGGAVPEKWEDGFFEAADRTRLFYRIYRPQNPKKQLVILHGFGEHAHRYEKFSQYFPDFQISIFDMRGMGQSEGERVYVESYDIFESDALDFLNYLDRTHPVRAGRILLGHSMGGLTLMRLWLRHQVKAERFIFSAPCFRVAVPDFALGLNGVINSIYPKFMYHNPVYYKNLSHCEFEMLSYKNDPWIMHKMSARLLAEMVRAGQMVIEQSQICFDSPVHFLLAGDDKLVRTEVAQKVFSRIVAPDKSLKIYKNFYHEIFNETDQVSVFKDLQLQLT